MGKEEEDNKERREKGVPDLKIAYSRRVSDDINPRSTEETHIPQCSND